MMSVPHNIRSAPVSFGLVVVSAFVFLLFFPLRWVGLLELFNYVPFEASRTGVRFGEPSGQWWRLITPTLIHFGWLHVVFNSLWLWEFGQRIERVIGSFNLVGLYLVSAAVSISVQYFWEGPAIFGGMSGVVYAFLGFLWAANLLRPGWISQPPPAILMFMLIWLAIGFVGALDFIGVGAIANGAHLGGLLIGFMLGAVMALLTRGGHALK